MTERAVAAVQPLGADDAVAALVITPDAGGLDVTLPTAATSAHTTMLKIEFQESR